MLRSDTEVPVARRMKIPVFRVILITIDAVRVALEEIGEAMDENSPGGARVTPEEAIEIGEKVALRVKEQLCKRLPE